MTDPSSWDMKDIDAAVFKEISKARVWQQVITPTVFDTNPGTVPSVPIDFSDFSVPESTGKLLVELSVEFSLSSTQVGTQDTCTTLARMAAKALALAEDTVFFQGEKGRTLLRGVIASNLDSAEGGILAAANPADASDTDPTKVSEPIPVPVTGRPGVLWGENVFAAVALGIAKLTAKSQAPKFALFLPTTVYADTYAPPGEASLVTTAERIKPLVEGGFMGTGTLPPDQGLLVALAGDPTALYLCEAKTQWIKHETTTKKGVRDFFRVTEQIQFDVRDPRSLVLLKFVQPGAAVEPKKK